MANKATEARSRRAAGRDRRRSRVTEPFEQLDQTAEGQSDGTSSDLRATAAKVVGSVVAAALLGAAAAAVKGLLERQRDDEAQEPEAEGQENGDVASAEAPEEKDARSEEPAEEEESPQAAEDRGAGEQQDERQDEQPEAAQGVSGDEAGKVVTEARRQLEGLVGVEPERVSGLARAEDGWSVNLEVVEVARVPESTDVLATYELKLDDDLNVVSVNRQRRYRRSQVEEVS